MSQRNIEPKKTWTTPRLMTIEPGSAEAAGKKGTIADGGGGGTKS